MPHVLIVDDHEPTRVAVHDVLDFVADDWHYEVAEAATGQQALDMLRAGTDPTVVLFDLKMPVMDGQQFAHHVLADPALAARCALICMTASATTLPADLALLLKTHAIPLLAKPFDLDVLVAVVDAAADRLPA